jgi:hypothetical protein
MLIGSPSSLKLFSISFNRLSPSKKLISFYLDTRSFLFLAFCFCRVVAVEAVMLTFALLSAAMACFFFLAP